MKRRFYVSVPVAGIFLSMVVATSEPNPPAPAPAPEPSTAPLQPGVTTEVKPSVAPSWDGRQCTGGLVAHYQSLVTSGCSIKTSESDLALTYRLLRNAGFAAAGRKFKSAELSAAFKSEAFCVGSSKYAPTKDTVQLSEMERDCVAKLKAREKALRDKGNQPPKAAEVFVLSQVTASVVEDAKRIAGGEVGGNNVSVSHTPGDGWQIYFNSEYMEGEGEDAFKIESSTIIMCDDAGENCSEQMAG